MTRDMCLLATGAIFSFMFTVCVLGWLFIVPDNKWITRLQDRNYKLSVALNECGHGTTGGAGSRGVVSPHKLDKDGREYIEEHYK